jgi:opacity protein-like surface antigen
MGVFPNPPTPPSGTILDSEHTGLIFNQVITESITWNPSARLYFQGNFSYVLSKTNTPADYVLTPNTEVTVLNFKNDYWTASASAGYALNEKTDLRAEYTYYRADNYVNNSLAALPYGMGAREYTVGAGISRQISKNVRLKLNYGYFHYTDQLSGGHNNYEAHSVFSSLQFRF